MRIVSIGVYRVFKTLGMSFFSLNSSTLELNIVEKTSPNHHFTSWDVTTYWVRYCRWGHLHFFLFKYNNDKGELWFCGKVGVVGGKEGEEDQCKIYIYESQYKKIWLIHSSKWRCFLRYSLSPSSILVIGLQVERCHFLIISFFFLIYIYLYIYIYITLNVVVCGTIPAHIFFNMFYTFFQFRIQMTNLKCVRDQL